MNEADKLFEELDYKKIFEKHIDWYSIIYISKDISIEFTSDKELIITSRSKTYRPAILSMQEIKAIYMKCKELEMIWWDIVSILK